MKMETIRRSLSPHALWFLVVFSVIWLTAVFFLVGGTVFGFFGMVLYEVRFWGVFKTFGTVFGILGFIFSLYYFVYLQREILFTRRQR